ncbi:PEP-CTERM sorting domain-containing protein [Paucibacter sp. M5-1]|uniref:PEP-CTERM sorting domain-containing protein n=1 Tax=Paucibacter sp. M5-1 TaxID=3015998 RepID=UPI0022B87095|nr:PEP-CTERM sorting domain-containing protein [Paucibacter sp. M5-1]MCZ7882954.1 PEP-CTERM sorting domain-containing protein [Paucibacter sp. M5-1]
MKPIKKIAALLAAAAALSLPTAALAGFVWNETAPGAGDLLGTAQTTYDSGFNTLSGIGGALTASVPVGGNPRHQVDLYKIRISDAASFSAKTRDTGFDTALYLFDTAGLGVYMNDDMPDLSGLTSLLPSGDASSPISDGIYYLAVAIGGFVADGANGSPSFLAGGFNDVLGGDAGAGALAGWTGFDSGSESPLSYFIELTGATNAELPEPGTIGLVLAAGLGLWASSRRRAPRTPSIAAA